MLVAGSAVSYDPWLACRAAEKLVATRSRQRPRNGLMRVLDKHAD